MPVFLSLSLLLASADPGPVRRLPPVDQCAADSGFAAFRSDLVEAIERRDVAHLLAAVADNIQIDFGGGEGREQFADEWELDRPETSRVWHELSEVLRLGCTVGEAGNYWSPSLFGAEEIDDPFATFLVIRRGSTIHSAADRDSPIIARLEWDLVEGVEWQEDQAWWRVRLADGREGFIRRDDLRSPVDYRAGFDQIDGEWRITAFIAGD